MNLGRVYVPSVAPGEVLEFDGSGLCSCYATLATVSL